MGVVKKQGMANSVWIYLGYVLGYVNMGLIMAELFTTEDFGFRTVIFQTGDFFAVVGLVGLSNIVNRFFPSFMNKKNGHGGMLSFVFIYWFVGMLLSSIVLLAARSWVLEYYAEKTSMLDDFYLFIIPFGAALALFEGLSAYCKALLKTTFPVFIREVAQRVFTSILLAFVWLNSLEVIDWMDFNDFMNWYLASYVLAAIALIIYIIKIGEFNLGLGKRFEWISRFKEMFVFGLFTWFNNFMQTIVKTTDSLMLSYFGGFASAGIYGLGSLIGNMVVVPSTSLRQIAAPLISRYFEEGNMKEIGNLYTKTCTVQLISGLFLYLLILVNLDVIFTIWRPEFAAGKLVIVFIGGARLFAGSTGLNNRIIVESKYFQWNFYFNLLMGILVVSTNLIFIPKYGIEGAAFASAISIVGINTIKVGFVYKVFKLQPFSKKTFWALAIGGLAFSASYFIPPTGIFAVDLFIRSLIFTLVFVPITVKANLSENLNELVFNGMKKIRKVLNK